MKRYFKEVDLLDSGKISIKDFTEKVGFINPRTFEIAAVYRIYLEDGGKKYSYEDFLNEFELKETEEERIANRTFIKEGLK